MKGETIPSATDLELAGPGSGLSPLPAYPKGLALPTRCKLCGPSPRLADHIIESEGFLFVFVLQGRKRKRGYRGRGSHPQLLTEDRSISKKGRCMGCRMAQALYVDGPSSECCEISSSLAHMSHSLTLYLHFYTKGPSSYSGYPYCKQNCIARDRGSGLVIDDVVLVNQRVL